MSSRRNRKTNSSIRIQSRIKSPDKLGLLIRTSLKKRWKSLLPILSLHRKCYKEKSTDRHQLLSKTQSAISRTNSETFKSYKHQLTNVWLFSTNLPLWSKHKVNRSIRSKQTSPGQRIMFRKQRKSCKKQNNIINAQRNVCVLVSSLDWSF
jgi:hypothetical protein